VKLTVFGATGGVGRHVVTQALDRGDRMPLVDGTRTIVEAMQTEGVKRYIGMATPSLRDRFES
jgi:uncharacterized protein YbjT (DUF2867 family)